MKRERHDRILELIEHNEIETQEELADKLRGTGLDFTQATVSRDIKELKLIKTMTADGRSKYAVLDKGAENVNGKMMTVLSQSFVSADSTGNITVVKTLPGMAQAAAFSIDSMKWPEILGTIAGDDTILIVCRTEKGSNELIRRFAVISAGKPDQHE
jgi:transcriptional regulator of arginine metabolism